MSCECTTTDVGFNNGYRLTISSFKDFDDTYINDGTFTYQIYDLDGTAVSGASGSFTADGSLGAYTATITPDILDLLTEGEEYDVRALGIATGTGYQIELSTRIKAVRRGRS